MSKFGKCEEPTNNLLISLKERRSKILFKNDAQRKVRKITIDGCYIKNETCCDYLLINEEQTEHYVELKGSDLSRALEQIQATVQRVSECPKTKSKKAFIVTTRQPKITAKIANLRVSLRRDFRIDLFAGNSPMEAEI